jgi:hypothetical protein
MIKILIDLAVVEEALEALEWHYRQGHSNTLGGLRLKIDEKALRNLKAALAEPTPPQEAKSWAEQVAYAAGWWAAMDAKREQNDKPQGKLLPWKGLTEEEHTYYKACGFVGVKAVEEKLRARNSTLACIPPG